MSFLWPQIISSRRFVESALHLDTFLFNLVGYAHFLYARLFHKSQIRKIFKKLEIFDNGETFQEGTQRGMCL